MANGEADSGSNGPAKRTSRWPSKSTGEDNLHFVTNKG